MADVIDFHTRVEFPKEVVAPGLPPEVLTHCMEGAQRLLTGPMAGCMVLVWDAGGIGMQCDNRAGMYTQEQLMWLAYGLAHLKGRGVVNPQATTGYNPPPSGQGA